VAGDEIIFFTLRVKKIIKIMYRPCKTARPVFCFSVGVLHKINPMEKNSRRDILLLFLVVLWALFVLGGYYYYHKPVTLDMFAAPLNALLDVLLAGLIVLLAGGLGRRILRAADLPALERAVVQFSLGAGILSLVWLAAGAMGLFRAWAAYLLLIAGLIFLWRDAFGWLFSFRGLGESWKQAGRMERALAVLCALLVTYQLLVALAPPTRWDALAYHLQLPRQYLAAGVLQFIPQNPYWGHPQVVEMLYTLAMALRPGGSAAGPAPVLGWAAGVLFLMGLLGFTNTQLGRMRAGLPSSRAGWMAVTATVAGYTFRHLLGWSYTDLFSALFGLAALVVFCEWLETRRAGWFLWAGIFSGLAAGTKWTSGVLALGIFLAALLFLKAGGPARRLRWRDWLAGGLAAFGVVLPWLVKNLVATGSPLYPYFFATPWFDAARMASANPLPEGTIWWQHILLPFSTTWAGIDSAPGFSTDLGPLLLLLAVPGFWIYRRDRRAQALALFLVPAALGIGIGGLRNEHLRQTRLYYAVLPCLGALAGWGWEWLQCQVLAGVRLRRILGAVAWLVMGLILWQESYWMSAFTPGRVLLGTETRQTYLEQNLGAYIVGMQALESLPDGARVLMLWEPRGLYAPPNAQADLWIDRWRTDRRELGTAEAILDRWRREGFTHLLVYEQGVALIRPGEGEAPSPDWTVLQETLRLLPEPVHAAGEFYLLYSLEE
jgi:hypothetical protein